jgi:Flp pilus assembly pilin Flp
VPSTKRSKHDPAHDVFGVLARSIPARLVEISRSGCLLESAYRIEDGTVSELRLESGGALLVDDVRVTRCVRVEGARAGYLVGAEFVQTRHAGEGSIRRAVTALLRGVASPEHRRTASKLSTQGGQVVAPVGAAPIVNSAFRGEGVMKDLLARFVREDEGQDLIEYGLLAGLITTALVALVTAVGAKVLDYFTDLNQALPVVD